jgi:hypothetical protein
MCHEWPAIGLRNLEYIDILSQDYRREEGNCA